MTLPTADERLMHHFMALSRPSVRLRALACILAICILGIPCLACNGGMHQKGEHQIGVAGTFGHAIKGQAIWPDGDGRADNAGVTVDYHYFVTDRLALGGAVVPYRNYNIAGRDAYAGEFQLGLRYYFFEFDLLDKPLGFYGELKGGLMQSSRSVPEEGTHTNFSQDSTLGVEWRLTENVSWQTGYRLRHVSNGYIFGSENPSQNDHQVFTGIAITWR